MAREIETKKDKYGFTIRPCRRCGGSGRYSFNTRHGSTCYGCSGTGWQHTPKAAKAYGEWVTALKAQRRPVTRNLQPGDVVTSSLTYSDRIAEGAVWQTVASVGISPRVCGWSVSPEGEKYDFMPYVFITFEDGTTQEVSGNVIWGRKGTVDAAPYVC